jgi:hypothetical protein
MRVADEIAHMLLAHPLFPARENRVEADRQPVGLGELKDVPEALLADIHAVDVHRHVDAAHAGNSCGAFEFLQRQIRILHRQRDRAAEIVGIPLGRPTASVVIGLRQFEPQPRRRPIIHRIGERQDAEIEPRLFRRVDDGVDIDHARPESVPERHAAAFGGERAVTRAAEDNAVLRPLFLDDRDPLGREEVGVGIDAAPGAAPAHRLGLRSHCSSSLLLNWKGRFARPRSCLQPARSRNVVYSNS